MKRKSITQIQAMSRRAEPIVMLTCYDATFARLLDESGVDMLLVGDSLGMVIQGHEHTLPVTLDEMIYHCRAVARGSTRSHIVGDLPFGSYQISYEASLELGGLSLFELSLKHDKMFVFTMEPVVPELLLQLILN